MEIVYSKQAIKTLRTMDEKIRLRIKTGIDAIPDGDIKPLRGTQNSYRLRIGDWRIIFSYKRADQVLVCDEDIASMDDMLAINEADAEYQRGETLRYEDIVW